MDAPNDTCFRTRDRKQSLGDVKYDSYYRKPGMLGDSYEQYCHTHYISFVWKLFPMYFLHHDFGAILKK